mgnify:CR=1 FL=1
MDDLDIKILRILQSDCSLTVSEIGKKVGLSSSPCWKRINKLIKDKIIIKQAAIQTGDNAGDGRISPYKDGGLVSFQITDAEVSDLVAFLESLTDDAFLTDPRFSNPWRAD